VSPLARRLVALERAPAARSVELRAFASLSEAEADAEPAGPGVEVVRIITRVPRSPGAITP
jgi:hypothetical protein